MGDAVESAVRPTCHICNDGAEFPSGEELEDHVINYHQTTLEKYQTTMCPVKVEAAAGGAMEDNFQFVACGSEEGGGGGGGLPADWADRCTFACSACDDFSGTSTAEVNVHLNKAHPGFESPGDGRARYSMSRKVAHQGRKQAMSWHLCTAFGYFSTLKSRTYYYTYFPFCLDIP